MRKKVLVAVKTYPTVSQADIEVSCTAGFTEDGDWIRLYPIPFRFLDSDSKYSKYQWIDVDVEKRDKDNRPESYRVRDRDTIVCNEKIDTRDNWGLRKDLVFKKEKIFTNKAEIISLAHRNEKSLVIFKATCIDDFVIEKSNVVTEKRKHEALNALQQESLFDADSIYDYSLMPNIPYKFSYKFKDDKGVSSKLMIEDWELGQLYLNLIRKHSEEDAVAKVKEKYFTEFVSSGKKDLYLFLGTTWQYHQIKARNPYVIIGVFFPPVIENKQLGLF